MLYFFINISKDKERNKNRKQITKIYTNKKHTTLRKGLYLKMNLIITQTRIIILNLKCKLMRIKQLVKFFCLANEGLCM